MHESPQSEAAAISEKLTEEERSTLTQFTNDIIAAYLSGDKDAILALFTEDAVLMPPGAPTIVGREGISGFVDAFPKMTKFEVGMEEMKKIGANRALVRGTLDIMLQIPEAGDVPMIGKFVAIRERQPDGSWKLTHDIFNSSTPPG